MPCLHYDFVTEGIFGTFFAVACLRYLFFTVHFLRFFHGFSVTKVTKDSIYELLIFCLSKSLQRCRFNKPVGYLSKKFRVSENAKKIFFFGKCLETSGKTLTASNFLPILEIRKVLSSSRCYLDKINSRRPTATRGPRIANLGSTFL